MIAALLIFRSGLLDPLGKPLGTDFLAYYTGSQLALDGKAETAYDYPKFRETQTDIMGTVPPSLYWLYPPTYFLFILPLALFPYITAWIGWLFLTGVGYCAIIKKIFPDTLTLIITLAFPGTLQNILQGQNGFLSAFLIGGGLLLLPSRPLAAGILLGMMTYKPHLSLLLPVALIANRQWLALSGFLVGSLGLISASVVTFGPDIWVVYMKHLLYAAHVLQSGVAPLYKAPTTYAFAVLLGADLMVARVLQAFVSLSVLGATIWLWSRPSTSSYVKAAGLVVGCLLFSPSSYDYDLAILAIPIAFMAKNISLDGSSISEKWFLVIVWVFPLVYPAIAAALKIQLGPLVLGIFFYLILRKATRKPNAKATPSNA